jgi:leader peptidase (prepilin peptidase)/N-methyltransferase
MVPDVFAAAVFLWLLLVMADTDIRGFVLPDALTMPFAALGLLHQAGRGQAESAVFGLWVGAGALAVVLVVATAVFRREVLGWGDVKLGAGLGAWLGYPMVIPGIGLGFILGAVAAVGVMIVGIVRRQWRWGRVYLPFGPFLAVAAVVVVWG